MKISYSGAKRFADCGESYRLHYKEHYRSKYMSAALLFGTAVDKAIEALLNKHANPHQVFLDLWTNQEVGGVMSELQVCPYIVYSNSDFDEDIILDEDQVDYNKPLFIELKQKKEVLGWNSMSEGDRATYNSFVWFSMKAKGLLMVTDFERKILPNIAEVLATQVPVELANGQGDIVPGFADWVVRWKGLEKPIVFDLKTSSVDYPQDAVLRSNQLATYVHNLSSKYENTRTAGYVVLKKRVNKHKTKACARCGTNGTPSRAKTCDKSIYGARCNGEWIVKVEPEIEFQVLIDEIPERTEDITIENYDMITRAIKQELFVRNFSACEKPWGKCEFYDVCHNGTLSSVYKTEEKK